MLSLVGEAGGVGNCCGVKRVDVVLVGVGEDGHVVFPSIKAKSLAKLIVIGSQYDLRMATLMMGAALVDDLSTPPGPTDTGHASGPIGSGVLSMSA